MEKKPIKITIFHCGFVYSGGGERIVLEQAKGLKNRGYQVEVYAPAVNRQQCFPHYLEDIHVRQFLPEWLNWLPFGDALEMVVSALLAPLWAARFKKTDIFFGANQPGAWLAFCCAKTLGKPYFVYLNQPNRLVYPRLIDQQTGWQNRKSYYLLAGLIKVAKPLVTWADRISFTSGLAMLVNGDYIGKTIKKIYQKPVIVCPGSADYQPLANLQLKPVQAFEGEFEMNNQKITKPYVLITNRHEPQKRFDYVIRALAKVRKKYPRVCLVIPGVFTTHTPQLIQLAKSLKLSRQVLFLDRVTEYELHKLYQNAAVYCYSSPDEDFGLGPVEAGGWGVPTVAWNHGGPTLTVVHQKTGYLAKPYEIDDYARGILTFLEDPQKRAQAGKKAWLRTKNVFSWDKHLDILEKEIHMALKPD